MTGEDFEELTIVSRRALLQRAAALAALTPAGALLAACGNGKSSSPASAGGKLSAAEIASLGWATTSTIDSLDLAKSFSNPSLATMVLGVEPLMQLDQSLQLKPWLASRMEERDPTTLVFTLRDGVTFTDGSPLTPADVVFSWQRHLDPKLASQVGAYIASMKSIAQTGPHEVTIKLSHPDALFKYATFFIHIYSAKHGKRAGAKLGTPDGGVLGTGMYAFHSFKPDSGVTCIRNERYWGTKPRARKIAMQVITDDDTRRLAIEQGTIAGSFDPPNGLAKQWNGTANVEMVESAGLNVTYLSFSVKHKPWNDVHVRRAVSYCLDRVAIVKSVLGGGGEPANDLATRTHWAGLLGKADADAFLRSLPSYTFSVAQAKAELAKSATPNGFSATIKVSSGSHADQVIALSLQQSLAQIGIKLKVEQIATDDYVKQFFTDHVPGIWISELAPVLPDPMDYYGITLPSAAAAPGGYNTAGYANAEVDRLIATQASLSGSARADALKRIARIVDADLPYAAVAWTNATLGLNRGYGFQGFDAFSEYRPWAQSVGKLA